ncbi:MAG: DUF3267 domain-containing protein [Bacillota bacterium]
MAGRLILPEHFVELERLEMNREVGVGLTGVGTLLMAFSAGGFMLLGQAMGSLSPDRISWTAWLLGFLLTFPLHEALHGLVARAYGARPRYGAGMAGPLPYFYCAPEWSFRRNQHLLVLLTPLVVLDLLALGALGVPALAPIGFTVQVLNTSGAVGDLWMAFRVSRYPLELIVVEEGMVSRLMGEPGWRRPAGRVESWWPDLGFGATWSFLGLILAPSLLWIPLDLLFGERGFYLEVLPLPGLHFWTIYSGPDGAGSMVDFNGALPWWLLFTLAFGAIRRRKRLRQRRAGQENVAASRIEP